VRSEADGADDWRAGLPDEQPKNVLDPALAHV
jgi:hypothetical protein